VPHRSFLTSAGFDFALSFCNFILSAWLPSWCYSPNRFPMLNAPHPLSRSPLLALSRRAASVALFCALAAASSVPCCAQSSDAGKRLKNRSLVWSPPNLDSPIPGVSSSPPCDLAAVLAQAAERTSAMISNLQNFTAEENISYRSIDRQNFVQDAGSSSYDYVVIFQRDPNEPVVDERRTARRGTPSPVASQSRGLPEIVLLFLPNLQPDYDMKCDGQLAWNGQPAWLVEFQQRADRPSRTFGFRTPNGSYSAQLKGRAWVAADSGEILHLETGLLHGIPAIKIYRMYLSITYAPVGFQSRDVRVWLPHSADVYYDYGELRTIIYHTFSDFLLFSVDTNQKIAKPKSLSPPGS